MGSRSSRALGEYRVFGALVSAGFRRYSTYRQATIAGLITNVVFGFLRCYVLLAVTGAHAAGYDRSQIVTYVWVSQGLIATVGLWGDIGLADRIRTGDVVSDLLRPVPPVLSYLATDLGRAGYAVLIRLIGPVVVGALSFPMYWPHRLETWPLFAVSVVLATAVCFCCQYLVHATAYWLLDARGARLAWSLASTVLSGLLFPLSFLPAPVSALLWMATPFPWLLQAPADVLVERHPTPGVVGLVAGQAAWATAVLLAAGWVQRRGEGRMVVQGG